MIKSSSPIWVLLSAFIFGIEKVSCNLIAVGVMIMAGELLTAFGEVEFDAIGFVLCACAAMCSGIRWTLMQLKVQKLDPPLKSAVVTMRVLAPSVSTQFLSITVIWLRGFGVTFLTQEFFNHRCSSLCCYFHLQ